MDVHLILVDDWELRGDGSGNMNRIQFNQMRRLCDLYEKYGVRGTFNAEVMQQIQHREWGEQVPALKSLADEWDTLVAETFSRGHDIQLHIHPQWSNATFKDGRWDLHGDWSILTYSREEAAAMLNAGKEYLESLLALVSPDYRCVSFRSGAWCLAPSPFMIPLLSELGIIFDMSIVDGLHYDLDIIQLDYRAIEEPFFPYYPERTDARQVSNESGDTVCCPTHSFKYTQGLARVILELLLYRFSRARYHRLFDSGNSVSIYESGASESYGKIWQASESNEVRTLCDPRPNIFSNFRQKVGTLFSDAYKIDHCISDLSQLNPHMIDRLFADINNKTRNVKGPVPVVLENHTKDIGNFEPIEYFLRSLSRHKNFSVLTASQVAKNIIDGAYNIRVREGA